MSSSSKYLHEVTEAADVQSTDYIVGYRTAAAGGMRRWKLSTTILAWIESLVGASGGVIGRASPTGYSGGGATDIHSIATVSLPTGTVILAPNMPPGERQWQVIASTAAESQADGLIRPADYDGTTNAKLLQLF